VNKAFGFFKKRRIYKEIFTALIIRHRKRCFQCWYSSAGNGYLVAGGGFSPTRRGQAPFSSREFLIPPIIDKHKVCDIKEGMSNPLRRGTLVPLRRVLNHRPQGFSNPFT